MLTKPPIAAYWLLTASIDADVGFLKAKYAEKRENTGVYDTGPNPTCSNWSSSEVS
jgi:hypothetical protein